MKKQIRWFTGIALIVFTGTSAFSSLAQQREEPNRVLIERERVIQGPDGPPPPPDRMIFEREIMPHGHGGPHGPGDFLFLATEMSFGGQLVKGAPYSAQAVTESVHTLGDGNRITNKSTAAIYRDSEGRTRREQTFKSIGPFATAGEPLQTILVNDPVAGMSFTLDPRTQVAHKMPMRFKTQFKMPPGAKPGSPPEALPPNRIEIERAVAPGKAAPAPVFSWGWQNHQARPESLGKQNIEGVEAEGTRSIVTIPAGEIGNERPIEIVNERWYSTELHIVVMTRHSDPRFGESSYRLTSIDRSVPPRHLFEVPAGYTMTEGPPAPDAPTVEWSPRTISGGVLNGKAINLPLPEYPPIARQARASGTVTVQITIDEDGNVISAQAGSGHPLLRAAGVTAAREAKFSPTKVAGRPVKVKGVLVYNFTTQ